jgi:hypothetical protein
MGAQGPTGATGATGATGSTPAGSTGSTGPAAQITAPTNATLRVSATAEVTAPAVGPGNVDCTLSTDGGTTVTRRGTPLVAGGQLTIVFSTPATTGPSGSIALSCTGQASTQDLTIQYVKPSGTTP